MNRFSSLLVSTIILLVTATSSLAYAQLGSDYDRNGVWDHAQQVISSTFTPGGEEYAASMQFAKASQLVAMIPLQSLSEQQLSRIANERARASECFFYVHTFGAQNGANALLGILFNSEQKLKLFYEGDKAIAGMAAISDDKEEWWKSCTGPVQALQNWPYPDKLEEQ